MVADSDAFDEEMRASAEMGALINATRHGGKADLGAVMGRILAEFPGLRKQPAMASREVRAIVERINSLSAEDQETLLSEKYPQGEKQRPKEGRVGLAPLPNAVKGKTGFRLPPEPSGFMTIGHAMAFTINYLYKETYSGQLWLRFEDTNPRKVAPRYYDSFRRGIEWLGIECDHEKNVSDDIEIIYQYGKTLLEQGDAYACSCDEAKVKRLRFDGTPCEHRDSPTEKSLKVWEGLLSKSYKEGDYVIRLRGDMKSENYSLRDTNLFRVIDHPHPITGTRYSLWPTYDLANAVEDEICGITHVLRSSEFRTELQQVIRGMLKFRSPEVIQFSRFNFKGTPVQKRLLRPLVEKKMVSGWDDPRMPTVDGLKRRGIVPQAIRDFTLQVGYTKTEHEYDWSMLLSVNRKLLDPQSKRIFFVPHPVELEIEDAPKKRASIQFHPQRDLGLRTIETGSKLFVPSADLKAMEEGTIFRLMDLYNVELVTGGAKPRGKYAGDALKPESRKLQWVTGEHSEATLLVPGPLFLEDGSFNQDSLQSVPGYIEEAASSLVPGDVVQFPRVGFSRLDSPGTFILAS